MDLRDIAREVAGIVAPRGRLVELDPSARIVFVGDVHGDLDAVERVFSNVVGSGDVVVFLGDVVDRGPASRQCLERVLRAKLERPEHVHLLMGNHEAWGVARFRPADFWTSLAAEEADVLAHALLALPLAARHSSTLLAVHAALPNVDSLASIVTVEPGTPPWRDMTWGDWSEERRPVQVVLSRPLYGPDDFAARSGRLGIRVLVRSHQPDAPTYLYQDRCLTLFTSSAYGGRRQVAVLASSRQVRSARDLELYEI